MTTCLVSIYRYKASNWIFSEDKIGFHTALHLLYNWLAYVVLYNLSFKKDFVVDYAVFSLADYFVSKALFLECREIILNNGAYWYDQRRFHDDFHFQICFPNDETFHKNKSLYRFDLLKYKLQPLWSNMVLIYCLWKKNLNAYDLDIS